MHPGSSERLEKATEWLGMQIYMIDELADALAAQDADRLEQACIRAEESGVSTLHLESAWAQLYSLRQGERASTKLDTIAGNELELERVKKQVGHDVDVRFTSPGVHDIGNFEVKLPQTVVTLIWVREVSCIVSGKLNSSFLIKICVFSTALLRITACNKP